MQRYVASYLAGAKPDPEERQKITTFPGVSIIDEASRIFLIEASPETADELTRSLPNWQISPERTYGVPDACPPVIRN